MLFDILDAGDLLDFAGRSARIHLRGTDADAVGYTLLDAPAPVWPGRVRWAQVEKIDDGVRVTWRRILPGNPSWEDYVTETTQTLTREFPGVTVQIEKVRHPSLVGSSRTRPF
ncbi:MAG: hypothetical protein ACTH1D_10230 [Mycobacteriaceae bacterium]